MIKVIDSVKDDVSIETEYLDYLASHRANVKKSWIMIRDKIKNDISPIDLSTIDLAIENHDDSKFELEEFEPYLVHYYANDNIKNLPENVERYNKAWLHHQNVNLHHWQYWTLIKDEGKVIPLDMPIAHVIEMLCDWHSFSAKDTESTAYDWYQKNKSKMILSDNTRKLVDKYIVYFKSRL